MDEMSEKLYQDVLKTIMERPEESRRLKRWSPGWMVFQRLKSYFEADSDRRDGWARRVWGEGGKGFEDVCSIRRIRNSDLCFPGS
jgi:hypothetical protein